jgi:malic enzyme
MNRFRPEADPVTGERYLPVSARGRDLLTDPILNKGTAFTPEERAAFGVRALLPPATLSMEQQLERVWENYSKQPDDLSRYLNLVALQDRNETLFYRLLSEHTEELTPIIYTPTVGLACQRFSHIYRKPRGLYITADHVGQIDEVLSEAPGTDSPVIVATDGEGILGLGDLGAGGMGIPIGKLSLYTLGAGIHPARCLPICLDVGTSNVELRRDSLYLGVNQPRLQGEAYYDFLDAFVAGVSRVFPRALLQWEDFSRQKAWSVLERYRDRVCSFNDDIQGTGAITLAGVHGVCAITRRDLTEQRFVIHGVGAGGGGIMHVLHAAMIDAGMSAREVRARVLGLDSRGLIVSDRPGLESFKQAFAADRALVADWRFEDPGRISLYDVVANFRPTVLIGTSGQAGSFDERLVREMAAHVERPAIFAISNPTSKTEVDPSDAWDWSDGRALIATGSPFDPIERDGRRRRIGQGNNAFCFPGIGLGVIVVGARGVSDAMLLAAARAVAGCVAQGDLDDGVFYPQIDDLRTISRAVARAVAVAAISEGFAASDAEGLGEDALMQRIADEMWCPEYLPYRAMPEE